MKNKRVEILDWGSIDYKIAWDKQTVLFQSIIDDKLKNRKLTAEEAKPTNNYLIICEHNNVFTLGKSGDTKHLLISEQILNDKNIAYYPINRGGDITYHGPGQLTIYPILDLDNFFTDIHKYLRFLEACVIEVLQLYNIKAGRIEGLTGVWLDIDKAHLARKICAFGIKASRWVTMHGLAFNINANIDYYNYIIPCGINNKQVTSLHKETTEKIDIEKVKHQFISAFSNIFEADIV